MKLINALKCGVISFVLTIVIIVLSIYMNETNTYVSSTIVGLIAAIILLLSIIGMIFLITERKKPQKNQIFVSFLINLLFLMMYSYLIISNWK
ncbi:MULTISPECIES: hypothetical protein [unclassified Polaribacter]|uniref:hypothetical protein n=1 Tax=unclassified Polaribacter TaxID=196858 RepID=UPI0011EA5827|nr:MULTISPECIES: hypothetical protein [unclassified Polaribacter]